MTEPVRESLEQLLTTETLIAPLVPIRAHRKQTYPSYAKSPSSATLVSASTRRRSSATTSIWSATTRSIPPATVPMRGRACTSGGTAPGK